MKILDRYILTTYLKTFFSVFIIIMLIFVLQTIWLYINELSGKDLELSIVLKFLFYFTPKLIPLVLPLTILLSSIMVFGSFSENYEFAAMKSTGISLQRAMKSLSIFIVGIGFITFFFANNVIPWAEINSFNLRKNIAKLKPAAFIAEGQFNQLDDGFNIKVDKKSGDADQYLEKVVIHKRTDDLGSQHKTIISETGEFFYKKNSEVLQLILYNGNYYEDISTNNQKNKNIKPFAKSSFDKYIINIDLSKINEVDMDEKTKTDKYNMLDIIGLSKTIDSIIKIRQNAHQINSTNLKQLIGIDYRNLPYTKKLSDNSKLKINILELFEHKKKIHLINSTIKSITNTKETLVQKNYFLKQNKTEFNKHIISFHEKFALGFACIILFFVGAPLGALIRKGGMGLPMVIAVLLFLTYHFIGLFATNSAKNGEFNPILASWFSTIIMLPLGIYLTKRATADRSVFEIGNIINPLKKIFNLNQKDTIDSKFLNSYSNEELINVIINYEAIGHDEHIRFIAFNILTKRGKTIAEIRKEGIFIDSNFEASQKNILYYKSHAIFAIWTYVFAVILLVLFFVFKNNKLPSTASMCLQLSIISSMLFIVYYIKSILNIFDFYKNLTSTIVKPNLLFLILGLPLYFIANPFIYVKIQEDIKQNCLDSIK